MHPDTTERVADSLLYCTRPDGECLRLGDEFNELKTEYSRKAPFAVNENTVTVCHKGGKLVCRIDEPQDFKIEVIGSKGKSCMIDSTQFDASRETEHTEAGWGQVIISPKHQTTHTKFKIQMEICDQ